MNAWSPYRVRTPVRPPVPDLPGVPLKPDPAGARTVPEFLDALWKLYQWAGEPSLRVLARRCGGAPSHSTFGGLLKTGSLPKLELVGVFIDALGLPEDRSRWEMAWRRLAVQSRAREAGRRD